MPLLFTTIFVLLAKHPTSQGMGDMAESPCLQIVFAVRSPVTHHVATAAMETSHSEVCNGACHSGHWTTLLTNGGDGALSYRGSGCILACSKCHRRSSNFSTWAHCLSYWAMLCLQLAATEEDLGNDGLSLSFASTAAAA